jgi:hypothetical protein
MKILILVISCQTNPYLKMMETSLKTWDSVDVEGVETIFYCGNPVKENTDKVIYFPIDESLFTMGYKTLEAYEWALKNKEFDYIARVNSSCYVNKKELKKYCETLPKEKVFAGLTVTATPKWMWGGGQFIFSRDIIEEIVSNRLSWDHTVMEDRAVSYLLDNLNITFTAGRACSIEKKTANWYCLCYGEDSIEFTDFADMNKLKNQFFIRCKQDGKRETEEYIMKQLYQNLI